MDVLRKAISADSTYEMRMYKQGRLVVIEELKNGNTFQHPGSLVPAISFWFHMADANEMFDSIIDAYIKQGYTTYNEVRTNEMGA